MESPNSDLVHKAGMLPSIKTKHKGRKNRFDVGLQR